MSIEKLIFDNLITNPAYGRKVIPFLRPEYFQDYNERVVFNLIDEYVAKYTEFPSKEALTIDLANRSDINDDAFTSCKEIISTLSHEKDTVTSPDWLIEKTEKFCQDKALYNAIMDSIRIMDDKSDGVTKGAIPELLSSALAVSFDTNIGHDFLNDFEARYNFYHRTEERIPFDIDYLNLITKGGLPRKSLSVVMAATGSGKSLIMCHMAAANLAAGKNVLYITLEMSEERIAERIDANLLNIPLDDLVCLPKETYAKKVDKLKEKTTGRLIIKEYPTSCAGSGNFRHLLGELKLKKGFAPDIIYVDYLNICNSSRLKSNVAGVNSYTYIKTIAEELRGLAVEFNLPIVSATQVNRQGFNNSDIDITNTSESMGLTHTLDMLLAVVTSEELSALGQMMFVQLKNRYNDLDRNKRFVVGVDKPKMRLYNVDASGQEGLMKSPSYSKPASTESPPWDEDNTKIVRPKGKLDKDAFEGFR